MNDSQTTTVKQTGAINSASLSQAFNESEFYAEWNVEHGYFFFPEEVDCYDALEVQLHQLLLANSIDARIEGIF